MNCIASNNYQNNKDYFTLTHHVKTMEIHLNAFNFNIIVSQRPVIAISLHNYLGFLVFLGFSSLHAATQGTPLFDILFNMKM